VATETKARDIMSEEINSESYQNSLKYLATIMQPAQQERLAALKNEKVIYIVAEMAKMCNPRSIFVHTGTSEDDKYIRDQAIANGEEQELKKQGRTIHFDDMGDQARDTVNTRYIVPKGMEVNSLANQTDREEGLREMYSFLTNSMQGKEMYVGFYSLGPIGSFMSIPAVQITDSSYVMHSEAMLYRHGYADFPRMVEQMGDFFSGVHSSGELTDHNTSKNLDKRRIYMDLQTSTAYSVNCQYAGNSVALKKLFLRLAIWKAVKEDWLAEHMFITGIEGPGGRTTYVLGAFPSGCGKTSTSMEGGIIGDDLAYIRVKDGIARTINPESGMFGIIDGVNKKDDPVVFDIIKTTDTDKEVIYSNILIKDGEPFWNGMGMDIPEDGINFSGEWKKGNKDAEGKDIEASHKNARFTIRLKDLENFDPGAEEPDGVPVGAIMFGGRDADTSPPILQTFDWKTGVAAGATIVSAGTATEIGAEGTVRRVPMSNSAFISCSLGKYLDNYYKFEDHLNSTPQIFKNNYFLEKKAVGYDGPGTDPNIKLVGERRDTQAWLGWIELRTNGDIDAIQTPIGFLPRYEDLAKLFKEKVGKDYSRELYDAQFSLRTDKLIARNEMQLKAFGNDPSEIPAQLFTTLKKEIEGLKELQKQHGTIVSPFTLDG
jgi:phosphoenolpyruvate carboxykinase (GTP)